MKSDTDQRWSDHYDQGKDFRLTTSQEIREILERLDGEAPRTFLEIGCGTGQLSRELYHLGFRGIGIDASTSAIQIAQSLTVVPSSELQYMHGNVEELDLSTLPSAPFGLITMHLVFAFIRDKRRFCELVSKALDEHGIFAVMTPLLGKVPVEKRSIAVDRDQARELLSEVFSVEYYEHDLGYFICKKK